MASFFHLLENLPYLADYERTYHQIFAKLTLDQHRSFRPFIKIIADFDAIHQDHSRFRRRLGRD